MNKQIESNMTDLKPSLTTSKEIQKEDESAEIKSTQLNLNKICFNGQTFLWDLLVSDSLNEEANLAFQQQQQPDKPDTDVNMEAASSSSSSSSSVCSSSTLVNNKANGISFAQHQKILKEAEKQLQTLLCLPSTDKRIRLQFIESCLFNVKSNRACIFSLRLLTKLFSSFQQYSNVITSSSSIISTLPSQKTSISDLNLSKSMLTTISPMQEQLLFNNTSSKQQQSSINNHHHHHHHHHNTISNSGNSANSNTNNLPANITEVHRIVALTEYNYAMMNIFFESLKSFTIENIQRLESENLIKDFKDYKPSSLECNSLKIFF
jgi:hypothetical protein